MATPRYLNTAITFTEEKTGRPSFPYYKTTKYPEIPFSTSDIYAIITEGDRLDSLSQQFYGNTIYYWIISAANPDLINQGSLFITPGTEIRIPTNLSPILTSFASLNNT